jgi:hypothetical protein
MLADASRHPLIPLSHMRFRDAVPPGTAADRHDEMAAAGGEYGVEMMEPNDSSLV